MKLIFATDDYEVTSFTQEGKNEYHDIKVYVQVNDAGLYLVNFNTCEVSFLADMKLQDFAGSTLEIEFDEEDLKPHDVCEALHHMCMAWNVGGSRTVVAEPDAKWKVIADYLVGEVETHTHDHGVREVYLSAKPPYVGKVCGYFEEHSSADIMPGSAEMIAVKIVPLIWQGFIPQKK